MNSGDDGSRDDEVGSGDVMRRRAGANRVKLWVFTEAHRYLVALGLLGVVFVAVVAVGTLSPNSIAILRASDPIETAFQAFIGATITGVTLVLTLNQLVLSQELGAVGDQRERMSGAMEFRRDVEDLLGVAVTPQDPATFMRELIEHARDRADAVRDGVTDDADSEVLERVDDLAGAIEDNADDVVPRLEAAEFGTFDAVSAALDFNYSAKINAARTIQVRDEAALTDDGREALEVLIETLTAFGPTREHVKTLYVQWELINLSRSLLGSAIPALLVSASMVLYYNVPNDPTAVAGIPVPVIVVAAAMTVATLPFVVLLAYVLRIATITKRTLSIGPFTLRD